MPRELPPRPNLEYLRNEAKELLVPLHRTDPSARLADAQRALARDYGFSSWSALKSAVARTAHVEVASRPHKGDRAARFTGVWRADVERSVFPSETAYRNQMLRIAVAGNEVSITDLVNAESALLSGPPHFETPARTRTLTLVADGQPQEHAFGFVYRTAWLDDGRRELHATNRFGHPEGRIRYEVDARGDVLTLRYGRAVNGFAETHVAVFDRVREGPDARPA